MLHVPEKAFFNCLLTCPMLDLSKDPISLWLASSVLRSLLELLHQGSPNAPESDN